MIARYFGAALIACACTLAFTAAPALAAEVAASPTTVSIPIGDYAASAVPFINSILLALIGWLFRKLPGNFVAILKTMQADQLLTKAIDYALNAVAGAAKGKVLTVDVANHVLAEALNYALSHGAGWLVTWLGGEQVIAQKIIARLNLDTDAAVVATPTGGVAIAQVPAPA